MWTVKDRCKEPLRENEKRCPRCKEWLSFDKYHKSKNSTGGLHAFCKECNKKANKIYFDRLPPELKLNKSKKLNEKSKIYRKENRLRLREEKRLDRISHPEKYARHDLKRYYGLDIDKYNELFDEQKGLCAICGKPESTVKNNKVIKLAVDHCHETMKIRGLLCHNCNHGLGSFKDSSGNLENAIEYLEKSKSSTIFAIRNRDLKKLKTN